MITEDHLFKDFRFEHVYVGHPTCPVESGVVTTVAYCHQPRHLLVTMKNRYPIKVKVDRTFQL